MDLTQIAVAAIGPLVTALVAGVLVALRDWQDRRRRQHDQEHALQRLRDQTEALDAWLAAHAHVQDVDPDGTARRAAVVEDLGHLQSRLRTELSAPPVRSADWSPAQSLRTLFLVGQRGGGAMASRVLFYLYLPYLALLMPFVIPNALASSTLPAAQAMTVAVSILLLTLPAIGLWALTRALARRASRHASAAPAPAPQDQLGTHVDPSTPARGPRPAAPQQAWR